MITPSVPDDLDYATWRRAAAHFDTYWRDYLHAAAGLTKAAVEEAVRRTTT